MISKIDYKYILNFILLVLVFMITSCTEDYVPKPKAYLRLDYPEPNYATSNRNLPFSLETNSLAKHISVQTLRGTTNSYAITVEYPTLKGTIFLTYKPIEADNNLKDLLRDAQKFTLEHTIKADEIPKYPYENKERSVYGMLSEVKGNAASPAQFYLTDSTNHFLTGSLYFNMRPNYDSILPAAHYLQNDMRRMIETVKWRR